MKSIEEYVRSIPDFPEPGIIFRDVTSVLQDPEGLKLSIHELMKCLEGTEFDVIADSEAEYFETVLLEGKVKVSNLIYPEQGDVVMCPNDKLSMKDGRLLVEKISSPDDELCWTRGLIGIDDVTFDADVAANFVYDFLTFDAYYATNVEVE